MDQRMGEVVNSLLFEKDNILKLIKDYEKRLSELEEKLKGKGTHDKSSIIVEDLELKDQTKHLKTTSIKVCWYFNKGYCRKREYCKYKHEIRECSRNLEGQNCEAIICNLRHRSDCKYWKRGFCFRGKGCAYLHRNCFEPSESVENKIKVAVKASEIQNTTENERDFMKVKEENNYLKKQISRLRDRNMIANDNIKILETEIKTLKANKEIRIKKINEVLQQRLKLESEIDHLKKRLGEDILDEESESC